MSFSANWLPGRTSQGFNQTVAGLREREELHETFGKHVSPQVRDEMLSGRAGQAGGLPDVTILFAALREFTTWVQATEPSDVVSDLNAYCREMDSAIRDHGGLVLQFLGDEIEAVFGAPMADTSHVDNALAAALAMQARLDSWNAIRRSQGKPELHHRIGIHSGKVVAGNIGSPSRMSCSLVGDVVNVASRTQASNKEMGTQLLVSAVTYTSLTHSPSIQALPTAQCGLSQRT